MTLLLHHIYHFVLSSGVNAGVFKAHWYQAEERQYNMSSETIQAIVRQIIALSVYPIREKTYLHCPPPFTA